MATRKQSEVTRFSVDGQLTAEDFIAQLVDYDQFYLPDDFARSDCKVESIELKDGMIFYRISTAATKKATS
jgi:hypothetical protein